MTSERRECGDGHHVVVLGEADPAVGWPCQCGTMTLDGRLTLKGLVTEYPTARLDMFPIERSTGRGEGGQARGSSPAPRAADAGNPDPEVVGTDGGQP